MYIVQCPVSNADEFQNGHEGRRDRAGEEHIRSQGPFTQQVSLSQKSPAKNTASQAPQWELEEAGDWDLHSRGNTGNQWIAAHVYACLSRQMSEK